MKEIEETLRKMLKSVKENCLSAGQDCANSVAITEV